MTLTTFDLLVVIAFWENVAIVSLSLIVLGSMFLSLFHPYRPERSQNSPLEKPRCCRRIMKFLGKYIFPQYNGNIKTDKIAHCQAGMAGLYLLMCLFIAVVQFVVSFDNPELGCDIQTRGGAAVSTLLYALSQWFLYRKASLTFVSSMDSGKPWLLYAIQFGAILIALVYPALSVIEIKGILIETSQGERECTSQISSTLVIIYLSLDIPLQTLNFLAFYLPLKAHLRDFETTMNKTFGNVLDTKEGRKKNNTEMLYRSARKALVLCILTIFFTQMFLIPLLFTSVRNSDFIPNVISTTGVMGFLFCAWFNSSSKWSLKQLHLLLDCCFTTQTKARSPVLNNETQEMIELHEQSKSKTDEAKHLSLILEDLPESSKSRKSLRVSTTEDESRKQPLIESQERNT
jgi:hypothetical protein